MNAQIHVQPLSHNTRKNTFRLFVFLFLVSLPFLYLYATGYRFDVQKPTNLISTGGMYIAVERTGAEIYIDNELMRETRTFRKAFYAQGLDSGTHRVHVQKEGFHTWVKELPVSRRLVTEAEAFNFPLVPQVRVISEWQTATGTMVVSTPLTHASSTNRLTATSTTLTKNFVRNEEFRTLMSFFSTTSTSSVPESTAEQIKHLILGNATTTVVKEESPMLATTTKHSNGVRLFEGSDGVYATWEGSFEQMPYYYCAPDFPRYDDIHATTTLEDIEEYSTEGDVTEEDMKVIHPVQTVSENTACDPTIRIENKWQKIHSFDFFPGSNDLVLLTLDDGVYVEEIDDRSWQNIQPLFMGNNLSVQIVNGLIYIYDGTLIYQVVLNFE